MKLQIISKLVKNQSQTSPTSTARNNHQNTINFHPKPSYLHTQSEYFSKDSNNINHDHLKINKPNKIKAFFDHFQVNCKTTYERVILETPQVRRKLTPILQSLKSTPAISPLKDDYQFSFKKIQSNCNILRNKTTNIETINKEPNKQSTYYIQQANKTKIKLRKFSSLMQLKNQQKTVVNKKNSNQIPVKRNFSLCKRQGSFIQLFTKQASRFDLNRHHTENAQQIKENSAYRCQKLRESTKTQSYFEQQKQRLNRIRRQLNQIYQMKKASQIRLKLY